MNLFWLLPAVAALSLVLTGVVRRYALAHSLIDVPNPRSSHATPTPRGGGIAVVASFVAVCALLPLVGGPSWWTLGPVVAPGVAVALLGFVDDHRPIAVRWRLLGHFVAAVGGIAWLGGAPVLSLWGVAIDSGAVGFGIAVLYVVWLLNLYNFMDGIDGIAGVEAVTVCAGAALLGMFAGHPTLALVPLLLAASVAGFLPWNLPPAKIFIGDAGSGFLGITLGLLSLQAGWVAPELFWGWVILLGAFIVDATLTLLRRLLRWERVYEAHRTHAYQCAVRRYGRHGPVTVAVGAINVLWLLPVAALVVKGALPASAGVPIAYLPLILLALKFRAGEREECRRAPSRAARHTPAPAGGQGGRQ